MKKIILTILLCGFMLVVVSGCGSTKNKLGGDEPLKDPAETVLSISMGSNTCVPIYLKLYVDGNYELFTAYEECKPLETCNLALKYTKSIKGTYDYDLKKIIEDSVNVNDITSSNNESFDYEITVGNPYIEEGYHYKYVVKKGQNNKYLEELLKKINVNLKQCANPEYVD